MEVHTKHTPYAEQDGDGMWEPACRDCKVLLSPEFADMTQRYPTMEQAVDAAYSIFAVVGHPAVRDMRKVNSLLASAETLERGAKDTMRFQIGWLLLVFVQILAYEHWFGWTQWTIGLTVGQFILTLTLEVARRRDIRQAKYLRVQAVLARGWQ